MDKLFHVFVSSTYSDLQEERSRVSEGLSKAGQVPEGMEIFPASSQKQMDFIKTVIDRCDYYVVVVGGRYGTTNADGASFTQLEYEYALSKGMPTLAFLHAHPEALPASKTDNDSDKATMLAEFRARLELRSLVDYWTTPDQLATKVVAAIAQEVSRNPGTGWIRGNRAASEQLLNEVNELRKSNEELRTQIAAMKPVISVQNLAELSEKFSIHYNYKIAYDRAWQDSELGLNWQEILRIVGPQFRTPQNSKAVSDALTRYMKEILRKQHYDAKVFITDRERILNQLELLGYMKSSVYDLQGGGQGLFYKLTDRGVAEVQRLNAIIAAA